MKKEFKYVVKIYWGYICVAIYGTDDKDEFNTYYRNEFKNPVNIGHNCKIEGWVNHMCLAVDYVDNRIEKFYFTFGSADQFPFKYGYIIIEAENIKQAIKVFRAYYPDVNEGIINCAFYYTEKQFMETCMKDDKCHQIIGFKEVK